MAIIRLRSRRSGEDLRDVLAVTTEDTMPDMQEVREAASWLIESFEGYREETLSITARKALVVARAALSLLVDTEDKT